METVRYELRDGALEIKISSPNLWRIIEDVVSNIEFKSFFEVLDKLDEVLGNSASVEIWLTEGCDDYASFYNIFGDLVILFTEKTNIYLSSDAVDVAKVLSRYAFNFENWTVHQKPWLKA